MGKLSELWGRLRPKPPVIDHEEEVQKQPEMTEEQLLDQIMFKLRQSREVVLVTINEEIDPKLSVEDAFLGDWPFHLFAKNAYESTMFQRLGVIPWRWRTGTLTGTFKRCRWRLNSTWGAWLVAGIPDEKDLAPTEVYLRVLSNRQTLIHPVYRVPTTLHNGLVNKACHLLGCRVIESRYFRGTIIHRLEPSIPRDLYTSLTTAVIEVY